MVGSGCLESVVSGMAGWILPHLAQTSLLGIFMMEGVFLCGIGMLGSSSEQ